MGHDGEVFKRLTWFGIGAAAGASGYVWAQQRVRKELDALGPDHLVVIAAGQAGRITKSAARTVAGAVVEGRSAMRDREDELLAQRDGRRRGGRDRNTTEGRGRSDRVDHSDGPVWPSTASARSEPWSDAAAARSAATRPAARTRPARW